MTFGQQLGSFGTEVFGTVTDFVDVVGDRLQTGAEAAQTRVAATANAIEISRAQAAAEIERKAQTTKLLTTSVYVMLGIFALIAVGYVAKSYLKK